MSQRVLGIGSLIGGRLLAILTIAAAGLIGSIIAAVVGAVILIAVRTLTRGIRAKSASRG